MKNETYSVHRGTLSGPAPQHWTWQAALALFVHSTHLLRMRRLQAHERLSRAGVTPSCIISRAGQPHLLWG